jgi:hypothetical protein
MIIGAACLLGGMLGLGWYGWYLCRGPRPRRPSRQEVEELQVLADIERHEDLI